MAKSLQLVGRRPRADFRFSDSQAWVLCAHLRVTPRRSHRFPVNLTHSQVTLVPLAVCPSSPLPSSSSPSLPHLQGSQSSRWWCLPHRRISVPALWKSHFFYCLFFFNPHCGLTASLLSTQCIQAQHKALKSQLGSCFLTICYFLCFQESPSRTNVRAISGGLKARDSPLGQGGKASG